MSPLGGQRLLVAPEVEGDVETVELAIVFILRPAADDSEAGQGDVVGVDADDEDVAGYLATRGGDEDGGVGEGDGKGERGEGGRERGRGREGERDREG